MGKTSSVAHLLTSEKLSSFRLQGLRIREIAELLGISEAVVSKYLHKHALAIPMRERGFSNKITLEELIVLRRTMSSAQLAEYFSCSIATIDKYVSSYGIGRKCSRTGIKPKSVLTPEYCQKKSGDAYMDEIIEETGFCGVTIAKIFRENNCILLSRKTQTKEAHWNWRGGRYITDRGYVVLNDGRGQLTIEHHKILQQFIGRELYKSECGHHLNNVPGDNRLENLVVMIRRQHNRYHQLCYKNGVDTTKHTISDILQILDPKATEELKMYAELTRIIKV